MEGRHFKLNDYSSYLVNYRANRLIDYYKNHYTTHLVLRNVNFEIVKEIKEWLKSNVVCGFRLDMHRMQKEFVI